MAEPVRIMFGDDNEGIHAQGDASGNLYTTMGALVGSYQAFEDDNFVEGDSPATHDFNAAEGRNAMRGYIYCDGAGDIQVAISHNGVDFGDTFTMSSGEKTDLEGFNIDKIRITHVADSSYRILLM